MLRSLWVLAVVACGKPSPPSNAPSPTDCKADTECTIAQVAPDPEDLCCDVTTTAAPMATAYLAFVAKWREQHCTGTRACRPLGLPGHPMPCAFEARCVANRCANRC